MLRVYPTLDPEEVTRQGETWWACDVARCDAEVHIENPETPAACPTCAEPKPTGRFCPNCGMKFTGNVPEGWRTNDPDDDPHRGAAQFCPKHAKRVYVPEVDAPETLAEHPPGVVGEQ